jgi:hypothetical protein
MSKATYSLGTSVCLYISVLEQKVDVKDLSFGFLYEVVHHVGIPSPVKGWDNEPNEGSKTEADDIERCNQYWKFISGSTTSPENVCHMWKSLSQVSYKYDFNQCPKHRH